MWLTTARSLVHGDIVAISDSSLTIREQDREVTVGLDEVRSVETRDGVGNGFLIGMVPGAVAGGLVGNTFATGFCSGSTNCDSSVQGYSVTLGAAGGALVGGLFGMMVDALIPGRETLVVGGTTVVTPVITPTKKAIDVAIRLR